jgi:photosystem II stability/assembly factor-like uncharacterized protein
MLRQTLWGAALSGLVSAFGAEPKHDLYVTLNLSGQGSIMGGKAPALSGVYRSTDRQNFEHVGHHHIRMFKVIGDPLEPKGLYLAALNGVVHSSDLGATWHILTDWRMTEPKGLAVDPNEPEHLYAGLPDGIAVSRNRGLIWQRMNDGITRAYTHTITVDRTRAGRVLAGTELGIYLTEDGARSWRLVQATADTTYDLRQSPHDPKVFFAVTAVNGALWSTDSGVTWKPIAGVPTKHTLHHGDFDPRQAGRLAICGWEAGVLISEDSGRTWIDRSAGLPNRQVWSVAIDPDFPNRIYAAPFLQPLHVSDDFGLTWKPLQFDKATVFNLMFVPRQ